MTSTTNPARSRDEWNFYCELYGFTADQLDATFTDNDGKTWKLIGIKSPDVMLPAHSPEVLVIESPDGKHVKAAVDYVKAMLLNPQNQGEKN